MHGDVPTVIGLRLCQALRARRSPRITFLESRGVSNVKAQRDCVVSTRGSDAETMCFAKAAPRQRAKRSLSLRSSLFLRRAPGFCLFAKNPNFLSLSNSAPSPKLSPFLFLSKRSVGGWRCLPRGSMNIRAPQSKFLAVEDASVMRSFASQGHRQAESVSPTRLEQVATLIVIYLPSQTSLCPA